MIPPPPPPSFRQNVLRYSVGIYGVSMVSYLGYLVFRNRFVEPLKISPDGSRIESA